MTRVTHSKQQPKGVYYWDYYILCRLNMAAAIAIQRMEYWDSTKNGGIPHAEAQNDALEANHREPTQDTSHWVYKAQDELQWELMGITGEKGTTALLKFLQEDVPYLISRHNPTVQFDRTKQYEFQAKLVQQHLDYLYYIIKIFQQAECRLTPVFYAIELLTRDKIYIEQLSVRYVIEKLQSMQSDQKLPKFLKGEIAKDRKLSALSIGSFSPFRNFAEWKTHSCGMQPAKLRNGRREAAECNPQECGSNTSNYNQSLQTVITKPVEAEESNHVSESEQPATAAAHSEIGNLSLEEIELILAHRQHTTTPQPLEETPPAETSQESEQAAIAPSVVAEPSAPPATPPCPAADAPLTDELIVQVFEHRHGVRYDEELRPFQLQAARALLELAVPVPLSVSLLERVYDECYDDWWRSHYGDLDVSHLTEKERAGSRRIVRLLKRVQNRGQPTASNGHVGEVSGVGAEQQVEWNGRMVTKEQAYREGYNGGFERYRDGEHEGDDLDAMVKKYQAQGLLPILESAGGQ